MEGQRLVYQFKEMPKNIVIIDDDKAELPSPDDLMRSDSAVSYERVLPSPELLLQAAKAPPSKKPNILRGGGRPNATQAPVATGSKTGPTGAAAPVSMPRIVTVAEGNQSQQSHATLIPNATGPR